MTTPEQFAVDGADLLAAWSAIAFLLAVLGGLARLHLRRRRRRKVLPAADDPRRRNDILLKDWKQRRDMHERFFAS